LLSGCQPCGLQAYPSRQRALNQRRELLEGLTAELERDGVGTERHNPRHVGRRNARPANHGKCQRDDDFIAHTLDRQAALEQLRLAAVDGVDTGQLFTELLAGHGHSSFASCI
jgi:hypothetical protein